MNTTRLRNLTTRVRRAWGEMDYVQRRLFEMQTGIPAAGMSRRVDRGLGTRPYRRDY